MQRNFSLIRRPDETKPHLINIRETRLWFYGPHNELENEETDQTSGTI